MLAQQYIVQWTDFHPLEDHEGLLSRALGGFDRCSEGGEASDVHGSGDTRASDSVGASSSSRSSYEGDEQSRSASSSTSTKSRSYEKDEQSRSTSGKRGGCGGGSNDDPDSSGCCWEVVERINPATSTGKFPSDFSLVRWRHQAREASDGGFHPSKDDRSSLQWDKPDGYEDEEEDEQEQAQCRVGRRRDEGVRETCPGPGAGDGAGGILGDVCGEGRDRGVPCVRAAAQEALGALRGHRWVKGVFREKVRCFCAGVSVSVSPWKVLSVVEVSKREVCDCFPLGFRYVRSSLVVFCVKPVEQYI